MVVSYGLWQRYFGGDPSLPGKTTLLDGKEFTVIGITPRNFCGLRSSWVPEIWVTTEGWATMVPGEEQPTPPATTAGLTWPAVFAPAPKSVKRARNSRRLQNALRWLLPRPTRTSSFSLILLPKQLAAT